MIENARIASTSLGPQDHGVFTFMIDVEWPSAAQSFGGYRLIADDKCWGPGLLMMSKIMEVVGVRRWEDLAGKLIRTRCEDGRIKAVGNIFEDKWFSCDEFHDANKIVKMS